MDMEKKKRLFAFDVLKLIAVFLILNSHFDKLYPGSLKLFAIGGTWGNAIFFAISGYFTDIEGDLFQYMKKRIIRLYPSVTIMTLISIVFHLRSHVIGNAWDVVTEFIWPTYYWFVGALVLYYLLIFLLEKKQMISSGFPVFSVILVGFLVLYYECCVAAKNVWCIDKMGFDSFEGWIKVIFFFYVFALGYYVKKNSDKCFKISRLCSAFFIFLGGIGYMGYKVLSVKSYIPMHFQIFAPVLIYIFAFGTLCLTVNCERNTGISTKPETAAKRAVICLSSLSLEAYLVQFSVIRFFEHCIFPINAVLAISVTFILSYLLKRLSGYLISKVSVR